MAQNFPGKSGKNPGLTWKDATNNTGGNIKNSYHQIQSKGNKSKSYALNSTVMVRDSRIAGRRLRATNRIQQNFNTSTTSAQRKAYGVFKSAFSDIENGNYSIDRINSEMYDSYDHDIAESFEVPSGDEAKGLSPEQIGLMGSKGVAQSMMHVGHAQLKSMNQIASQLIGNHIKVSEASTRVLNASIVQGVNQLQNTLYMTNAKLDTIGSTLGQILEFQNKNTLKYYEQSSTMINGLGQMLENLNKSLAPTERKKTRFDVSRGLKGYLDHITSGLLETVFGGLVGSGGGVKSIVPMLTGGGRGGKGAVPLMFAKMLLPQSITGRLDTAKRDFKNLADELLDQIGDKLENSKNPILQSLAGVFGNKRSKIEAINMGSYTKGAMPWNGIAQKALTEVIPELLASIDASLSHKDKRYYDYDTGKFMTSGDIQKRYNSEYQDRINVSMNPAIQKLSDALAESGKTIQEQNRMMTEITAMFDDMFAGGNVGKTTKDIGSKLGDFGLGKQISESIVREISAGIRNGIESINDLHNDIAQSNSVYRNITNSYGKPDVVERKREQHRRHRIDYASFSRGDPKAIIRGIQTATGLNAVDVSKDVELQQLVLDTLFRDLNPEMERDRLEALVRASYNKATGMDNMAGRLLNTEPIRGVKGKVQGAVENLFGDSLDNLLDRGTSAIHGFIYNTIGNLGQSDSAEGYGRGDRFNKNRRLRSLGYGKATTFRDRGEVAKDSSGRVRSEDKSSGANEVSRAEKVALGADITKLGTKNIENNDRVLDGVVKSMNEMPPATDEIGAFTQMANSVRASMAVLVGKFSNFGASIFGKEGIIHNLWNSDARKKVTEKLFTGENAIFGAPYQKVKAWGKDLWTKTKGELGKGYDYVRKAALRYKFGDDYENDERYKNSKFWNTWTDREWIKEKLKTTKDDAKEKVSDLTGRIKDKIKGLNPEADEKAKGSVANTVEETNEKIAKAGDEIVEGMKTVGTAAVGDLDEEPAKKEKRIKSDFLSRMKKHLPKALAAGAVGAGVGLLNGASSSLLGSLFLPGGPITGAIVGTGLSILSQTETFKNIMFGKLNEETGKREGGLISENMRNTFKKAAPAAIGGAAIGALHGLAKSALGFNSGLGVMGMQLLPGGILGGAMFGAGIGLLKNSDKFKDLLFGKPDKDGKRTGTFLSKGFNKIKEKFAGGGKGILKKALGGAGVGALTGTILSSAGFLPAMLSIGGPVGMGLAGLGLGIASSTKRFNEFLFGTEYVGEDGKKHRRENGLLVRARNLLKVNFIEPVGEAFKSRMLDLVDWAKESIKIPFQMAFGPIIDSMKNIKEDVTDFVKTKLESFGKAVYNSTFGLLKKLFSPLTKAIGFIGKTAVSGLALGARVVTSPIAALAQGASFLVSPKRRKEEKQFRRQLKEYRQSEEGQNVLQQYWDYEAQQGNKRNFFQRLGDRMDFRRGRGELGGAFRKGYNAELGDLGLNTFDWRNALNEKYEIRKNRKARHADERKWAKIDRLRQNIVNKDLHGNSSIELTDEALDTYRKKFSKLGIDEQFLGSSKDLMDLLYHRNDFRSRMNGEDTTDAIVDADRAQAQRDTERNDKLDEIIELLEMRGRKAGGSAYDEKVEDAITTSRNKQRKRASLRAKHHKLHGLDFTDPRFEEYDFTQFTGDILSDFGEANIGKKKVTNDEFINFIQERYNILPKSKIRTGRNSPVPEGLGPIPNANGSPLDLLQRLANDTEALLVVNRQQLEETEDQTQVIAQSNGMDVDPTDIKKKTGTGLRGLLRKINPFNLLKKKEKEDARAAREAGESAGAASGLSLENSTEGEAEGESGGEAKEKKQSIFSKIFKAIGSFGGKIFSTKIGRFVLGAGKTLGIIGLLGGIGFTIAELIHPGTVEKVGNSIRGVTDSVENADKKGGIVASLFDTIKDKIKEFWNQKVEPWWNTDAKPWIQQKVSDIRDFLLEDIPKHITTIGNWITDHAQILGKTIESVAENLVVPVGQLILALFKGVTKGIWGVIRKHLPWPFNQEEVDSDFDDATANNYRSKGINVRNKTVASSKTEAEAINQLNKSGLQNASVVYNESTGQYEVVTRQVLNKNTTVTKDGRTIGIQNSAVSDIGVDALRFGIYTGTGQAGAIAKAAKITGKILKPAAKVGTKAARLVTGVAARIPGINLIGKPAHILAKGADNALTFGSKLAKSGVATEVEGATRGNLVKLMEKAEKALAGIKNNALIGKVLSKFKGVIGENSDNLLGKLINFIKPFFKSVKTCSSKVLHKISELAGKAMAKFAAKVTIAGLTLTVADLVFAGTGAIFGAVDAPNLFGIPASECTAGMRCVSAIIQALLSISWGVWLDFLMAAMSIISGGKIDIKHELVVFLYKLVCGFNNEAIEHYEASREALDAERQIYNALNDTNLDMQAYNDLANKSVVSRAIDGLKSFFTGKKAVSNTGAKDALTQLQTAGYSATQISNMSSADIKSALGYGKGVAISSSGKRIRTGVVDTLKATSLWNRVSNAFDTSKRLINNIPDAVGSLPSIDITLRNIYGLLQAFTQTMVANSAGTNIGYGKGPKTPNYKQGNGKWSNLRIGTFANGKAATMKDAGCGPTALSIVANELRGIGYGPITPGAMGAYAASNGYISNGGANSGLFTEGAARLGMRSTALGDINAVQRSLASGRPTVLTGRSSGGNDPYTSAGHIVVADRLVGDKARVLDPMTGKSSLYSLNNIARKTDHAWSYSLGYGRSFGSSEKTTSNTNKTSGSSSSSRTYGSSGKSLDAERKTTNTNSSGGRTFGSSGKSLDAEKKSTNTNSDDVLIYATSEASSGRKEAHKSSTSTRGSYTSSTSGSTGSGTVIDDVIYASGDSDVTTTAEAAAATEDNRHPFLRIIDSLKKGIGGLFTKLFGIDLGSVGVNLGDATSETSGVSSTGSGTSVSNGAYTLDKDVLTSLSGTDRARYLAAATSQLGYYEKSNGNNLKSFTANPGSSNFTKYGKEIGNTADAWCAFFASWCAKAAGIPTDVVPRGGSCTYDLYNVAKKRGIFKYRGEYKPVPGDLILLYWNGTDVPRSVTTCNHVGIVESADNDYVYTIEGNTYADDDKSAQKVCRRKRKINAREIVGYIHPKWTDKEETVDPTKLLSLGYGNTTSGGSGFIQLLGRLGEGISKAFTKMTGLPIDFDATANANTDTTSTGTTTSGTTSGSSGGSINLSGNNNGEKIWKYLRRQHGLSAVAASGVLGNIKAESDLRSQMIEGWYLKNFPGFDKVNDNASINNFVENVLFPQYNKQGIKYSRKGYTGSDGNLYPGMGIAQWTGGNAQRFFNYMKNHGYDLWDLGAQLNWLSDDIAERMPQLWSTINTKTTPRDAAHYFLDTFEMQSPGFASRNPNSYGNPRAKNAEAFYEQYKNLGYGRGDNSIRNSLFGLDNRFNIDRAFDVESNRTFRSSSRVNDDHSFGFGPGMTVNVDSKSTDAGLFKILDLLVDWHSDYKRTAAESRETLENKPAVGYGGGSNNVYMDNRKTVNNIGSGSNTPKTGFKEKISAQHNMLSLRNNLTRTNV